ncbi:hypothetical protein HpRN110_13290 [Helicobacter pylori]|uniref:hypothetical protein n=1 Tax=Helicobacter pylori TaxID=210 RepID=UPI0006836EAD|nr:hypothetical protein [Helicobacter pylori]KMZ46848.1 hypothetical protein AC784_04505 [Helicobacter pylori]
MKYLEKHKARSNETPKVSQVAPKKVNKKKSRVAQKEYHTPKKNQKQQGKSLFNAICLAMTTTKRGRA